MIKLKSNGYYEIIFNQVAKLLENDFKLRNDSSDNVLGMDFSIVSKKYKYHGFRVSCSLGSDDLGVNFFTLLPLKTDNYSKRYIPEEKVGEYKYPKFSDKQLIKISDDIKKMEKAGIEDIKFKAKDMNQVEGTVLPFLSENGIDLRMFNKYNIKIDYDEIFTPSYRTKKYYVQLIEAMLNSPDPKVKEYINHAINVYFEHLEDHSDLRDLRNDLNRLSQSIIEKFDKSNRDKFIDLVQSFFMHNEFEDFDEELDGSSILDIINLYNDPYIEGELMSWFYNRTESILFLNPDVRSIFLF